MSEIERLEMKVAAAERRIRLLGMTVIVLGATLLVAAMRPPSDILRARGLIITDAAGRERVVIGAPMREASGDAKLAGSSGIAVLDSAGRLNIALGAETPLILEGGRMQKRIASFAGLTFYDPRNGQERGGLGAFADGRAGVCIDYGSTIKEAACMLVAPTDRFAAVALNGPPSGQQYDRVSMTVGADGAGAIKVFGSGTNGGGVTIRAGKGEPAIAIHDSTGRELGTVRPTSGAP